MSTDGVTPEFLEAASGCFEPQKTFEWVFETQGTDVILTLVHDNVHRRSWRLKGVKYEFRGTGLDMTWEDYESMGASEEDGFERFSKEDLARHLIQVIMRNNDLTRENRKLQRYVIDVLAEEVIDEDPVLRIAREVIESENTLLSDLSAVKENEDNTAAPPSGGGEE